MRRKKKRGSQADKTMLTKTTRECGATEVVLDSHVWDDGVTYGELDADHALSVLGNTYHARRDQDGERSAWCPCKLVLQGNVSRRGEPVLDC